MIVKKAYNIRLYPNKGQANFINKTIGGCKFAYNLCLKAKQYLWNNYHTDYNPKMGLLREEYKELSEIDSQGLSNAYMDLKQAYSNWFKSLKGQNRGQYKAPKFKDLKSHNGSYRNAMVNKDVNKLVVDDKIFIPCCKFVKFKGSIDKDAIRKIWNITVKRTNSGKYYCSICCDVEVQEYEHTGQCIGLDLGIKDLVICSDGTKYSNPKYQYKAEKRLKKLQKDFSKKKKGSKNREKARLKLAIGYEKLANKRNDYLHQITNKLIRDNSVICIEDLNVSGMTKNHHLAKAIQDCSFGTLVSMLKYKALWHNRQIVEVGRYYPSSKTCSCCGHKMKYMGLEVRNWTCSNCGEHHDRDVNAAKNILDEGLRILDSVGQELPDVKPVENSTMDERSVPNLKSSSPMKQEDFPLNG